jgi:hypothetical protein
MDINFKSIGVIETPYLDYAPYQPVADDEGEFRIVVNPEYEKGLSALERFKYIYVLYFINKLNNEPEMTVKQKIDFEKMRNPIFWIDNKDQLSNYGIMNPSKRKDAHKRFKNHLRRFELSSTFRDLIKRAQKILDDLKKEKHPLNTHSIQSQIKKGTPLKYIKGVTSISGVLTNSELRLSNKTLN